MIELDSAIKNDVLNNGYEPSLAPNAAKNNSAIRFREEERDIRAPFFRDTDRIIHSKAYTRYIDKTQVFYLCENDHLTHRVLHVQLVSKIARTIGRVLRYNEDLIEAIALGHDVGHTPFGHTGERFINDFCRETKSGSFCHNMQSFRQFYNIENKSQGINLCVQTLDGILCHNGELVAQHYSSMVKRMEDVLAEYNGCVEDDGRGRRLIPMTMEGCIVRVSDIIAYIGRDIEDAITVNLIKRYDIPKAITEVLGNSNKQIVNSLISDIINNSFESGLISFSKAGFKALNSLRTWNNSNIYNSPRKCTQDTKIETMFRTVLGTLLEGKAPDSVKRYYDDWLNKERSTDYINKNPAARKVADYVSGMTDDFLMSMYSEMVIPKSFGFSFGN